VRWVMGREDLEEEGFVALQGRSRRGRWRPGRGRGRGREGGREGGSGSRTGGKEICKPGMFPSRLEPDFFGAFLKVFFWGGGVGAVGSCCFSLSVSMHACDVCICIGGIFSYIYIYMYICICIGGISPTYIYICICMYAYASEEFLLHI
jgi:hypothetical protein